MILRLNEQEFRVLRDALTSTIEQLDRIMESAPNREVADASNTLSDILDKMKGKNVSKPD